MPAVRQNGAVDTGSPAERRGRVAKSRATSTCTGTQAAAPTTVASTAVRGVGAKTSAAAAPTSAPL